jgi:hypothetical protein
MEMIVTRDQLFKMMRDARAAGKLTKQVPSIKLPVYDEHAREVISYVEVMWSDFTKMLTREFDPSDEVPFVGDFDRERNTVFLRYRNRPIEERREVHVDAEGTGDRALGIPPPDQGAGLPPHPEASAC